METKITIRDMIQLIKKYQDPREEEVIMVADIKYENSTRISKTKDFIAPNTADSLLNIVPKNILNKELVKFETRTNMYDSEGSINIWYKGDEEQ